MAKGDIKVKVTNPAKGLVTRMPSKGLDSRVIVEAQNVRAEKGVLKNAPGYERIIPSPRNLDSPANLIFQANILNSNDEIRTTPIIGTSNKLYTVTRRSRALSCSTSGGGGGGICSLEAAFIGDSGRIGSDYETVSNLIKSWTPDIIVHLGDMVYADGVVDSGVPDFDETIGLHFYEYIGGYAGVYGIGPALEDNKFFPVLGNHDWDDGVISEFYEFFNHAENPNKRYYHFKRGPCHFIILSGYTSQEPDGVAVGSDQQEWAEGVVADSDCPFIFVCVHFPLYTSDVNYSTGQTNLRDWPLMQEVSAVISGHSHNMEVVRTNGITQLIAGNGGHSLRNFTTPVTGSEYRYNADYGALRLNATSDEAVFRFYSKDGTLLHTETLEPRDSEDVSGICYIGDVGKEVFTLEIRPDEASAEVGSSWPFRAFANYQDGTTEDVTESSTWTSSDDSIGALAPTGVATGISPGVVTVTAEYLEQTDTAEFSVFHSCLDDPYEILFTVARGTSMGTNSEGTTRLEHVKEAINLAIEGFNPEADLIGLVSFAGTYATQTEDVTLDSVLTSDFASVSDVMALLSPSGGRSVAEALDVARAEITGSRHVEGNLRAVVLVLDGPATITDPDGDTSSESAAIAAAMGAAAIAATAIKALDDTALIVVGYRVPAAHQANVRALASPGYYFKADDAEELNGQLGGLAHFLCSYPDPYYYVIDPDDEGIPCGMPIADFRDLTNWDIVRGCVDLCGVGPGGEIDPYSLAFDVWPGNGMYLDLVGTNIDNTPDMTTTCAKIQSKTSFSFVTGKTYKLSVYLAGNGRFGTGAYASLDTTMSITGGVLAAETETITDYLQPFTAYEYTFTMASDKSGKIVIDHEIIPPTIVLGHAGYPRVGNMLDRVILENVTDAETMLDDNFDLENPCEV